MRNAQQCVSMRLTKTSLAKAILGLWPGAVGGRIKLGALSLTDLSEADYRELRGEQIYYVAQDPIASFNPSLTIGFHLLELLVHRRGLNRREAAGEALDWLERVGLRPAREIARLYVHQLSGGMAQRAVFAMAVACEPKILIADEPFSSLDPVTASGQIELLRELRRRAGFSMLLITHDLELALDLTESVSVMKDGRIVEAGPTATVFSRPRADYTRQLLSAAGLTARPAGRR